MSFYSVLLLSLIQGITEFLPVSSSAHLLLSRLVLGVRDNGVFVDVAAHLGSLLAVIWFYRKDVWSIIRNFCACRWKNPDTVLGFKIIFATLPIVLAGFVMLCLGIKITDPIIIVYTSILAGICLWCADVVGKKKRDFLHISFVDALLIGVGQVFSVLPGVSRSGSTVTVGLLRGLDRKSALKFSFMLAIPTVMLAFFSGVLNLVRDNADIVWNDALMMVVFSALFSIMSINIMMKFVHKCSFKWFGIYRILLGIVLYFVLAK